MPGECLFLFFLLSIVNYIRIYNNNNNNNDNNINNKTVALVFVPNSFENTSQISKAATGAVL